MSNRWVHLLHCQLLMAVCDRTPGPSGHDEPIIGADSKRPTVLQVYTRRKRVGPRGWNAVRDG